VTTFPVPSLPKVELIHPSRCLIRLFGHTPARLIAFVNAALLGRPDLIGGFHLQMNGMMASLLARMIGARSVYFCVGGPAEILNGGVLSENRLFGKLKHPDQKVENFLLRVVSTFDAVVVMGERTIQFFRAKGVNANFFIISGGLDMETFRPQSGKTEFDLIYVGRLVPIKCLELFLKAIHAAKKMYPTISACVVGDGPLLQQLTEISIGLGLQSNVKFMGYQSEVISWLQRSKIFMLTSVTEGLSLAMMEAMMSGLPVIVPKVGDLDDLVNNGVNGYLVDSREPEAFGKHIVELLQNKNLYASMSRQAHQAALRFEIKNTTQRWNRALRILMEAT